jgi:hypothetical protein
MSLQSAISHMASALASAALGPMLLTNLPDGKLGGMDSVAWLSISLALAVPLMLFIVERQVRMRAAGRSASSAQPATAG